MQVISRSSMARIYPEFQFLVALLLFLLHGPLHSCATNDTTTKSKGFSMKLIDRDSIHSPLYAGNLTQAQRTQKSIERSISRLFYLKSKITNDTGTDEIQSPLTFDGQSYIVEVNIGTPPTQYFLVMDIGSGLSWVQCNGCYPCEPNARSFNWKKSRSYRSISCLDQPCAGLPCAGNECRFTQRYAMPVVSNGVLATETFTFTSSHPDTKIESLPRIIFGCAYRLEGFHFVSATSGIMGLSKNPDSLVSQLPVATPHRFSYCLLDLETAMQQHTYLRFGQEAGLDIGQLQSTPLVDGPGGLYFVKLRDIIFDGKPMDFDPGYFDQGPKGGGVIFDAGVSVTFLKAEAYLLIEPVIKDYFSRTLGVQPIDAQENLRLCYATVKDFKGYPTMTLHFDGGDMILQSYNVFIIRDQYFCLGMLPSVAGTNDLTIVGSLQQQNFRIMYDNSANVLSWEPQICDSTH